MFITISRNPFVTIRNVTSVSPLADNLDVCVLNDFAQCVTLRGEFNTGDEVLFIEDGAAIINMNHKCYDFLKEKFYKCWKFKDKMIGDCYRIRRIVVHGMVSDGVIFSTKLFTKQIDRHRRMSHGLERVFGIEDYEVIKRRALKELQRYQVEEKLKLKEERKKNLNKN